MVRGLKNLCVLSFIALSVALILIYFIKELSVLCPVIFIIESAGISAKNALVAKERRAVWLVTKFYFGSVRFANIPFLRYCFVISSLIPANSTTILI